MSSPAADDQAQTFDMFGATNDSGSSSKSSSDSGSDLDSDSDSDSGLDSCSSTDRESGSGTDNPPLSRDELLAYLENMRQRFSTRLTSDSFADQDEQVLIVTSKKKLGPVRHFNVPQLMYLPEI